MAIRRQKLDRKANLTLDGDRVIDMPPGWAFTIDCPHHGKITLDFNPYRERGRGDIAGHMRDACWSLRHEVVGITLKGCEEVGVRRFWRFLDDLDASGEFITRLDQIDRKLLDRYLAWMELQTAITGKNKNQKWSLSTKRRVFHYIKALLGNRQKRLPELVSPGFSSQSLSQQQQTSSQARSIFVDGAETDSGRAEQGPLRDPRRRRRAADGLTSVSGASAGPRASDREKSAITAGPAARQSARSPATGSGTFGYPQASGLVNPCNINAEGGSAK